MGWVFRHSPYDRGTFAVHLAVADSVNDQNGNRFWMAVPKLAKKARTARTTARYALQILCDDGYLVKLRDATRGGIGGGETAEYEFLWPEAKVVFDSRGRQTVGETPQLAGMRDRPTEGQSVTVAPSTDGHETTDRRSRNDSTEGQFVTPNPKENPSRTQQETSEVEIIDEPPSFVVARALCEQLADHVGALHATAKRPTVTKAWVNDMERMLRIDHRDPNHVAAVIEWVHRHDFWSRNILSPAKLRKQFDRMVAQGQHEQRRLGPHVRSLDKLFEPIQRMEQERQQREGA